MTKKSPHAIDIHVGNRLRLRRAMLGMSQEKLGDHLGITFQQVQKYEKGTNRISASKLQMASEVLGVPVAYFFEGTSQPQVQEVNSGFYAGDDVLEFIATREGLAINRAILGIHDQRVRTKLLGLLKSLSGMADDVAPSADARHEEAPRLS
ncbi:Transcriptional regulator, contains XRE-family HTH domain [Rhizobium sp. RU20A]|nr:Transcriptional regulator, contains XRE-family HTH domain [Rhizobium sp. RU20A]